MTVWRLTGIPLSPIHIGDGNVWSPEGFDLRDDGLVRFNPVRVLADLPPGAQHRFTEALRRGELIEAQRELRRGMDPERHDPERIAVGSGAEDIAAGIEDPKRRVDLRPFVRTGGRPYIPGSSIKGAIRTAVVNMLAQRERGAVEHALSEVMRNRQHDALEETALGRRISETERDLFRFVTVADTAVPEGDTRIDRVENWRPGKQNPAKGMRMFFERLRSAADGGGYPKLSVSIGVDEERLAAVLDHAGPRAVGRRLAAAEIWDAINDFYWRRWRAELDGGRRSRYFADQPGTRRLLERLLRTVKSADKTLADTGPRPGGRYLLLRIGRFSHFESLSVEDFRRGHKPQARHPADREMTEGGTRTVVEIGADRTPVPFGWLLLYR